MTKNRVGVVNVKVPSPSIVIEAEMTFIKNPCENVCLLDVLAMAKIVIGSFVNDVEPIVPLAVVVSVKLIELP